MKQSFSVMIAQLNPTLGDIDGNFKKIKNLYKEAILKRVDLLAFPEMFLTGYQTQDLIRKKAFMADVSQNIERLANDLNGSPSVLLGAPLCESGKIYNAYYLIAGGCYTVVSRKHHLPNTNVFDEQRTFSPGLVSEPFEIFGIKIGCPIC